CTDDRENRAKLPPSAGYAENSHYEVVASLSGPTDADTYQIRSARAGGVLTVSLRAVPPGGVAPRVQVLDKGGHVLPGLVLVNGGGEFVYQVTGLQGNVDYLVRVTPGEGGAAGNLSPTAAFPH